MSTFGRMVTYLKNAWGKEPVIVSSAVIAVVAVALPLVSPYTKYTTLMNERMPYHYPGFMKILHGFSTSSAQRRRMLSNIFSNRQPVLPVRDDGNMPDIPAHPCDKEGELDWLKK